jgi:S-DNA-T family DNA segregation ATPase FtsK/SpoIIIE
VAERANVEEKTVVEPETSRPKKSHLPFNVMMLKQDKLKWEERKKRREQEENINQKGKESLPLLVKIFFGLITAGGLIVAFLNGN